MYTLLMKINTFFYEIHFLRRQTLSMTREIQRSFRELFNKTNWIDDETKRLATEKVNAMSLRIGYPDFILQPHLLNERYKNVIYQNIYCIIIHSWAWITERIYSTQVVIQPDEYFENTLNILQHLTRIEQDRFGNTVNKTLWNTAPAVVNAYYSRNKNQISQCNMQLHFLFRLATWKKKF